MNMTTPLQAMWRAPRDLFDYSIDAAQRAVLYTDILRQRGDQYFEHLEAGQPPVLAYGYEVMLDGADFDDPVNYYLVRIDPGEHAVDASKRPFVIIDPRAGHGPGIGGFKRDSQVGVALRAGHPVYFVAFRDRPEPGQTLEHVKRAEAAFLEHVDRDLHPDAPHPCVIGNCQAGWAVAMLAAVNPEVTGPIILNGAPMSYWAGANNNNPMRYLGGLMGGTWIASLLADLGDGLFDGAYLVQNFENLNPSNTLFGKQYNVWSRVDTEGPRYLGFERWWNGFFLMNDEEMEFIVDNLFIGNKLGSGGVRLEDGRAVSLRDIQAPVVVFASGGDDITPPQQALNWIADVYPDDDALLDDGQVIVYTLHDDIGHLGIFVSGRVARREHAAIMGTVEVIEDLPPGLYEMLITDAASGEAPEVRFVERSIADIARLDDTRDDERAFATLAELSRFNAEAYRTFMRPWVRAWSNEKTAALMRRALPARAQHQVFSSRNPVVEGVGRLADAVRARRRPAREGNTFCALERAAAGSTKDALDAWRDARDEGARALFEAIYGPMGLGALFPGEEPGAGEAERVASERAARHAELSSQLKKGGFVEGFSRAVVMLSRADRDIEPELFDRLASACQTHTRLKRFGFEVVLERLHAQHVLTRLFPEEARTALPSLLYTSAMRADALELARQVVLGDATPNQAEAAVLEDLAELLPIEVASA
jgi:hypothetical protein